MKEFIIKLAEDAGKIALDNMGKAKISSKGEKNTVTDADKEIEKMLIERIKEKLPESNFCAEESENKKTESDYTWYIDPIDGTANYTHSDPHFAISIAMTYKNELKFGCVYIPVHKELFFAEKGKGAELNGKKISVSKTKKLENSLIQVGVSPLQKSVDDSLKVFRHFTLNAERARDMGFCAGQLAYVACGRADGFVKYSQHPWDFAAGILLVAEAGGKVTDMEGKKVALDGTSKTYHIISSNEIIHDDLMTHTKGIKLLPFKENWY